LNNSNNTNNCEGSASINAINGFNPSIELSGLEGIDCTPCSTFDFNIFDCVNSVSGSQCGINLNTFWSNYFSIDQFSSLDVSYSYFDSGNLECQCTDRDQFELYFESYPSGTSTEIINYCGSNNFANGSTQIFFDQCDTQGVFLIRSKQNTGETMTLSLSASLLGYSEPKPKIISMAGNNICERDDQLLFLHVKDCEDCIISWDIMDGNLYPGVDFMITPS